MQERGEHGSGYFDSFFIFIFFYYLCCCAFRPPLCAHFSWLAAGLCSSYKLGWMCCNSKLSANVCQMNYLFGFLQDIGKVKSHAHIFFFSVKLKEPFWQTGNYFMSHRKWIIQKHFFQVLDKGPNIQLHLSVLCMICLSLALPRMRSWIVPDDPERD